MDTQPADISRGASCQPHNIGFFENPALLLLVTVVTVFLAEIIIMLLLEFLPPLFPWQATLLDATMLSVTVFPSLYFLFFRPMQRHIRERRAAEIEKDQLIETLQKTLEEVKTLRGIIPICASCKKVRNDEGLWQKMEAYVSTHADVMFSHSICDECAAILYPDLVETLKEKKKVGE